MDDEADDVDRGQPRRAPPGASRLDLRDARPAYRRALGRGRTRHQNRARYPRHRRVLPIEELIGLVIKLRGLTDGIREQCVSIAWREMVGERIANNTSPGTISRGVLTVWTWHSVWMHELRFSRAELIEQINRWTDARRAWLGSRPFVSSIRFALGTAREPVVDPDDLHRLRGRYRRRLRSEGEPPPPPSNVERQAILAETSVVEDDELRAIIERVRTHWNR